MNVTIGNYRVTNEDKSCSYGFNLYETSELEVTEKVAQHDGKNKLVKTGEMKQVENHIGFYPNLQKVADKLFWLDLKRSDATTLEECLTVMGATRKLIKSAGWTNE